MWVGDHEYWKRLRKLRIEHNLTQNEVSILTGIKRSSIASYELNEQLPSVDKLIQLANLYKVSLDYLCGLDNSEIRNTRNEK